MNPVSASLSHVSGHVSWWSRIANPWKQEKDESELVRIDTEDFSDHMLRDIGIHDGRATRGQRTDHDDLSDLLRDHPKRFL
jgi:hypothetical protein